jgi:hypothetical protein
MNDKETYEWIDHLFSGNYKPEPLKQSSLDKLSKIKLNRFLEKYPDQVGKVIPDGRKLPKEISQQACDLHLRRLFIGEIIPIHFWQYYNQEEGITRGYVERQSGFVYHHELKHPIIFVEMTEPIITKVNFILWDMITKAYRKGYYDGEEYAK